MPKHRISQGELTGRVFYDILEPSSSGMKRRVRYQTLQKGEVMHLAVDFLLYVGGPVVAVYLVRFTPWGRAYGIARKKRLAEKK